MNQIARQILPAAALILGACDGDTPQVSQADLDALQAQVTSLQSQLTTAESQLAALQTQADTNSSDVVAVQTTLLDWEDILAAVSVDAGGDIVFSGVNVRIDNGAAQGSSQINGKGNLVLGYNEPRERGNCVGGTNPGSGCSSSAGCTGGGTCEGIQVVSTRTGSHNIIIGQRHSYDGDSGLAAGIGNIVAGSGQVAIGAGVVADTDNTLHTN